MIVVKVELHSYNTGKVTELGRMHISSDGGLASDEVGNYDVKLGRKGQDDEAIYQKPQRTGRVEGHRRLALSVWVLVAKALASVGFKTRE